MSIGMRPTKSLHEVLNEVTMTIQEQHPDWTAQQVYNRAIQELATMIKRRYSAGYADQFLTQVRCLPPQEEGTQQVFSNTMSTKTL